MYIHACPGPGEYDPDEPSVLGKGKLGLLCSRDTRLKPINSTVPGPGTYQVRQHTADLTHRLTLSLPPPSAEQAAEGHPPPGCVQRDPH